MRYPIVLFDLDGTLTNPGLGITNSVMYSLKKYGIEGQPRDLFIVLLDRHCTSLMRNFILFQGNRPYRPFPITENIMKKRECSKMKYIRE